MAKGNPLQAKTIFEELDAEWWHHWSDWNSAKVKADEKKNKKPKK